MPVMLQITCDKCDATLEVPENLAGRKIACPKCGDINLVPAVKVVRGSAPSPGESSPPAPASPAPARRPASTEPERRVLFVRAAMLRGRPMLALLVVGGLLAACAGVVYWGLVAPNDAAAMASAAVGVALLMAIIVWRIATLGDSLEITTRRCVYRRGLLRTTLTEVRHENIQTIRVEQSVLDRLLRIGEIEISSSGESDSEIVMRHLPSPTRVRDVIDGLRDA